jgi:hypothetical protein
VLRTTFGCEREEEVIMRNKTNKGIYRDIYIYLFYYKRCSLLYALASVGGQNMEKATLFVVPTISLHIFVCTCWFYLVEWSVHGHESLTNGRRGIGRK